MSSRACQANGGCWLSLLRSRARSFAGAHPAAHPPRRLERRRVGQHGAGRVRNRRCLPRQHCVRIAGKQGVCAGTAAGEQTIQQRTELTEDRVCDIHSRGRVRPGRGGNGHWIVDKQRLLRSRPSDPAAKSSCANRGQRERHTQRRSGQWPSSIRDRKHVPGQRDTPQTPLKHRVLSDTQVTPVNTAGQESQLKHDTITGRTL